MEFLKIESSLLRNLLTCLVSENLFKTEHIKKIESFDVNNFNSYLENKEFCIHLNFDHTYHLEDETPVFVSDLYISFTKGKIYIIDNEDDSFNKIFEIDIQADKKDLRKTFEEIEKQIYINKNALFEILKVMENL